jgi:putative tryptophan/tyrosine transport system substrate-binding protein
VEGDTGEDVKKKVTILTLSPGLFAFSAMHSAFCFLGAMLFALSIPADAQQPRKTPRIGILSPGSSDPLDLSRRGTDAFQQGLHKLGWVDGKNIVFEYRWANENEDRLPVLAAELLLINVDVILVATPMAAHAAKKLTKTVPIVATVIPGAGVYGLVDSLHRPGGNVTGLSFMSAELGAKRLELLKEVIPGVSRVAVLANVENVDRETIRAIESKARSLGVRLEIVNVKTPDEIPNAFSSMSRVKPHALTVLTQAMFVQNRTRIVELAAKCRLPAIYHRNEFVTAGGLMSYGPDHIDLFRRAASYVDKILRGANPADLPVEQPTKFELGINLKTARQLDLKISPEVLMWADKVIK